MVVVSYIPHKKSLERILKACGEYSRELNAIEKDLSIIQRTLEIPENPKSKIGKSLKKKLNTRNLLIFFSTIVPSTYSAVIDPHPVWSLVKLIAGAVVYALARGVLDGSSFTKFWTDLEKEKKNIPDIFESGRIKIDYLEFIAYDNLLSKGTWFNPEYFGKLLILPDHYHSRVIVRINNTEIMTVYFLITGNKKTKHAIIEGINTEYSGPLEKELFNLALYMASLRIIKKHGVHYVLSLSNVYNDILKKWGIKTKEHIVLNPKGTNYGLKLPVIIRTQIVPSNGGVYEVEL